MNLQELQARGMVAQTELEAVKAQLLPTAQDWSGLLAKATALTVEIAGLPGQITIALQSENAKAIGTARVTVALAVRAQIEALGIAELFGHPVNKVTWIRGEGADVDGVSFLEQRLTKSKVKGAKAEGAGKAQKGVGGLKARKIYTNGTEVLEGDKPFVMRFGTEAQKAGKYPHKQAEKVLEVMAAQGWKLTEKPATDTSSAASVV